MRGLLTLGLHDVRGRADEIGDGGGDGRKKALDQVRPEYSIDLRKGTRLENRFVQPPCVMRSSDDGGRQRSWYGEC